MSALISSGDRDRVAAWIDEAVAAGAKVAVGGSRRRSTASLLLPTVLTDVDPGHEGLHRGGVRAGGRGAALRATSTTPSAWPTTPSTGCRRPSSRPTSTSRSAAARELDFGGVLVNEVPTFRADQMPYGGVRDSGNTREGPHYAVREMTETRLVVLG